MLLSRVTRFPPVILPPRRQCPLSTLMNLALLQFPLCSWPQGVALPLIPTPSPSTSERGLREAMNHLDLSRNTPPPFVLCWSVLFSVHCLMVCLVLTLCLCHTDCGNQRKISFWRLKIFRISPEMTSHLVGIDQSFKTYKHLFRFTKRKKKKKKKRQG